MIKWVVRFIRNLVMWIIRQTFSLILFGTPYVIRAILSTLGIALQLSVLSFLALVKGTPKVAKKVGEDWAREAVERGIFPSLHQLVLADILTVVAFMAIFTGFIIDLFTVILAVDFAYMLMAKP
jgi:hypothetical protein